MEVDLSRKEMKAASTACAVASEIAKARLGDGEVLPELLLAGFTSEQLGEFIRIMRELEQEFDNPFPSMVEYGIENNTLILDGVHISPRDRREWRESRGGYGEEKHSQGK